jgi:hypothetical protein
MTVTRMRQRIEAELKKQGRTFEERLDDLETLFKQMLAEEKVGNGS